MSDKPIRTVESRIYSLPMNLHKYQLHLLEQHRTSLITWSASTRINTEGRSLIMKSSPGVANLLTKSTLNYYN